MMPNYKIQLEPVSIIVHATSNNCAVCVNVNKERRLKTYFILTKMCSTHSSKSSERKSEVACGKGINQQAESYDKCY